MSLALSNEQKVEVLLRLPWTINVEADEDGEPTLTVSELPAVIGVGDTEAERAADFWSALRSVLSAYVEEGENPPLPATMTKLPWEVDTPRRDFVWPQAKPVPVMPSGRTAAEGFVFGSRIEHFEPA